MTNMYFIMKRKQNRLNKLYKFGYFNKFRSEISVLFFISLQNVSNARLCHAIPLGRTVVHPLGDVSLYWNVIAVCALYIVQTGIASNYFYEVPLMIHNYCIFYSCLVFLPLWIGPTGRASWLIKQHHAELGSVLHHLFYFSPII